MSQIDGSPVIAEDQRIRTELIGAARPARPASKSDGATPREELDTEHDKRENKNNVDVGAKSMEADPAQEPEHQQDYEDRPEHCFLQLIRSNSSVRSCDVLAISRVASKPFLISGNLLFQAGHPVETR